MLISNAATNEQRVLIAIKFRHKSIRYAHRYIALQVRFVVDVIEVGNNLKIYSIIIFFFFALLLSYMFYIVEYRGFFIQIFIGFVKNDIRMHTSFEFGLKIKLF